LLPILENAIEAVPSTGKIHVDGGPDGETYVLVVSNECDKDPSLSDKIYEPDFTSKPGHSGLGLAVVHRLIESRRGASIRNEFRDESTVFTIELPRRQG